MAACSPGRKPPRKNILSPQTEDNIFGLKNRQSGWSSDEDASKLSAVAKTIAQFECRSPKKNEFLLRRDSVEKARNSLRLYKEKRRSSITHSDEYFGSPKLSSLSSDSFDSPSSGSTVGSTGLDVASQFLPSQGSPSLAKKPAFSMPDPLTSFPAVRAQKQLPKLLSFEEEDEDLMLALNADGTRATKVCFFV